MASPSPAQIQALLMGPAGPPPAGQQAFNPNPPSRVGEAVIVDSILFAISTATIALRLCTHAFMDKRWFPEDYFGLLFWLCLVGEFVPTFFLLHDGIGKHMWDITLASFLDAQYYSNINTIFYALAILFIKVAIILQILRIFFPTRHFNRVLFWSCWIWTGIISVFYIIDFFLSIFQCTPRAKISNPFLEGTCLDTEKLFQATGLFNIFSDVAILLLPLSSIYGLHTSWQKKLQIYAVFAVGILACVASILRTYYTWRLFSSTDLSWDITYTGYWTWVEATVGTIVFCLPSFPRPFVIAKIRANTIWSEITSRTRGSGSGGSGSGSRASRFGNSAAVSHEGGGASSSAPSSGPSAKDQKPYMPHMVVSVASWEEGTGTFSEREEEEEEAAGSSSSSRNPHDIPLQSLSTSRPDRAFERAGEV